MYGGTWSRTSYRATGAILLAQEPRVPNYARAIRLKVRSLQLQLMHYAHDNRHQHCSHCKHVSISMIPFLVEGVAPHIVRRIDSECGDL